MKPKPTLKFTASYFTPKQQLIGFTLFYYVVTVSRNLLMSKADELPFTKYPTGTKSLCVSTLMTSFYYAIPNVKVALIIHHNIFPILPHSSSIHISNVFFRFIEELKKFSFQMVHSSGFIYQLLSYKNCAISDPHTNENLPAQHLLPLQSIFNHNSHTVPYLLHLTR